MRHPFITIQQVIGKGTYGTVYSGYHSKLKIPVALKKMQDTCSSRREIKMLQEMQPCQHVVRMYDSFVDDDGDMMVVMELVAGDDGGRCVGQVQQGKLLGERAVRNMSICLAEALLYCHDHGFIYGDVKPQNVLFLPDNRAKLIDFGCCRKGDAFKWFFGTPAFAAPEKFRLDFGYPSDTWGLGIIMYMLVTGQHPYVDLQLYENDVLHRYGWNDIRKDVDITDLVFDHPGGIGMSDDLKDLLHGLLEKDPCKRMLLRDALAHPWWHTKHI